MRLLIIFVAALILMACQSEVDKCVSSYMSAREVKLKRESKEVAEWEELKNKKDKTLEDEIRLNYWKPEMSKEGKEEAEARFRYACLTAAGKK